WMTEWSALFVHIHSPPDFLLQFSQIIFHIMSRLFRKRFGISELVLTFVFQTFAPYSFIFDRIYLQVFGGPNTPSLIMTHVRKHVCVDGEASETDDESDATLISKIERNLHMVQSSYRDDVCVDGEASETDDDDDNAGVPSRRRSSSTNPARLDVSGIKIIENIEDAPPEHPVLSTTWRAMVIAAENQRVKIRRKHLVEARKLEKDVDKRFASLQHSGRAIRPATDALLNIEVMFEKLAQNCDKIQENRKE
ncbi:hypothetical protein PENTCL1PPCAC_21601, partial [Pristionchus entomophagus]